MKIQQKIFGFLGNVFEMLYNLIAKGIGFAKEKRLISRLGYSEFIAFFMFIPFVVVVFKTSIPNAMTCIALQLVFSGIASRMIFDKLGIQYIKFDKYRKDIEEVTQTRRAIILSSLLVFGLILMTILSKYDIVYRSI